LVSLKFYINNNIRIDYNRFLIQSSCVRITNKLLYMPLNDSNNFTERNIEAFSGAINLSNLENFIMRLQFSSGQRKVVIHNIYFNYLRYSNGMGGLLFNHTPNFIENSIEDHPIEPIIGNVPNVNMLDMSGNFIVQNTGTSGHTGGPTIPIFYPIQTGNTIYLVINVDRSTCNISHEEIEHTDRYMSCSFCSNNFIESAIKQWLRQTVGDSRTCPTCRRIWLNYNIYINSEVPP
jgi:hypothetical protein